jgi:phosphoribosylanthranilate isomerase
MTEIKFCGLTRAADVELAIDLGAAFVGAVFAGGPRRVTADQARSLFEGVASARRVGVFGDQSVEEIARSAETAALDVVQLHGDPTPEHVSAIKAATGLETWGAIRVANDLIEAELDALMSSADAILFDTRIDGALGGTGRAFDWSLLTNLLDQQRRARARIVLAGGLTPPLVPSAIAAVRPDVVDVSSGVEMRPGVKDHELMRAFVAAVRSAA